MSKDDDLITQVTKALTDQNAEDIVGTAWYGGITYWATELTDEVDVPDGTITTIIDEDGDYYHLSVKDIQRAYAALLQLDQRHVNSEIHRYIIDSWRNRSDEDGIDCGDIDAAAADCIVQVACFDEVVYG